MTYLLCQVNTLFLFLIYTESMKSPLSGYKRFFKKLYFLSPNGIETCFDDVFIVFDLIMKMVNSSFTAVIDRTSSSWKDKKYWKFFGFNGFYECHNGVGVDSFFCLNSKTPFSSKKIFKLSSCISKRCPFVKESK